MREFIRAWVDIVEFVPTYSGRDFAAPFRAFRKSNLKEAKERGFARWLILTILFFFNVWFMNIFRISYFVNFRR